MNHETENSNKRVEISDDTTMENKQTLLKSSQENSLFTQRIQRAVEAPGRDTLTPDVVIHLQDKFGNAFVRRLLSEVTPSPTQKQALNATETLQRIPVPAEVIWDVTHVVKEENNSIFGDNKDFSSGEVFPEGELERGEQLVVDMDDIFVSRRGPNQENPQNRQEDQQQAPQHNWYRVRYMKGKNVANKNVYIREGTFRNLNDNQPNSQAPNFSNKLVTKNTPAKDIPEEILKWFNNLKYKESMDSFNLAYEQNRMTVRSVRLDEGGRKMKKTIGPVNNFYDQDNTKKDSYTPLDVGISDARDKPKNFYDPDTGVSNKSDMGLHDLSGNLLDHTRGGISEQMKYYTGALIIFTPLPSESDLQVFAAMMDIYLEAIGHQEPDTVLKRLDPMRSINHPLLRMIDSMMTRVIFAQSSDMGTHIKDVNKIDGAKHEYQYGFTGNVVDEIDTGKKIPATETQLDARKTDALQYTSILRENYTKYKKLGHDVTNEIVVAYRQQESTIFPMYAIQEKKKAPFYVIDINHFRSLPEDQRTADKAKRLGPYVTDKGDYVSK